MFKTGQEVDIAYTGYTVRAQVIGPDRPGWWTVEEISNSMGDSFPEGSRPYYVASETWMRPAGEPLPPGPFDHRTGGARLDQYVP